MSLSWLCCEAGCNDCFWIFPLNERKIGSQAMGMIQEIPTRPHYKAILAALSGPALQCPKSTLQPAELLVAFSWLHQKGAL